MDNIHGAFKSTETDNRSFSHTLYWETYELSAQNPVSPSGLYRFVSVYEDKRVKLLLSLAPGQTEVVMARSVDDKTPEAGRDVFVVSADSIKQTAVLRELRSK